MTRPDYCPVSQEPCQAMCVLSDVRCQIQSYKQLEKQMNESHISMDEVVAAGDSVLMQEQALLLRECRDALDSLIKQKPMIAGLICCGSTTLGNLRAMLYDHRPQGVFGTPPSRSKRGAIMSGGSITESDRELLKLAAWAAGVKIVPCTCKDVRWPFKHDESSSEKRGHWNPFEDDGDALRLAVCLLFEIDMGRWSVAVRHSTGIKILQAFDFDRCSATRRAIVRAAAEIGKGMQ